jgi:hypothetical protein
MTLPDHGLNAIGKLFFLLAMAAPAPATATRGAAPAA